jgi:hypothetical protein
LLFKYLSKGRWLPLKEGPNVAMEEDGFECVPKSGVLNAGVVWVVEI